MTIKKAPNIPLPNIPDRGCRDGGPSCLECWLPMCKWDMSDKEWQERTDLKHHGIAKRINAGKTPTQVMAEMQVSKRTVARAMERVRAGELETWLISRSSNLAALHNLKRASALVKPYRPPRLLVTGRKEA